MINSRNSKKKFSFFNPVRALLVFPSRLDAGLSALAAILLTLAFPDFELWFLAWFAFVPLLIAVERNKNSTAKCFWLGLLNGFIFFTGTCWWLTNAPIKYGGIPTPIAFFLLIPATLGAGFFVGIFCAICGRIFAKSGIYAIFFTPFVWTACEFARLWLTGNAWNALGYSQAFVPSVIRSAEFGGVFLVSFLLFFGSAIFFYSLKFREKILDWRIGLPFLSLIFLLVIQSQILKLLFNDARDFSTPALSAVVIALQPNVPMSGLSIEDYFKLRNKHIEMAETALRGIELDPRLKDLPRIVIFPESPMSFQWKHDSEFREFVGEFVKRNKVSLIFNAGEPTTLEDGYHNSAIFINERGEKTAQYDKIRLVPFGEFVPEWLPGNQYLPTVVGRAKPGKNFSLMPFGSKIRAGVMICYESAFGDISNSFVQNGADVLIEITNDGYGGNTPILRQHLANAVFRAVETNRPVVRVTNVGISAYIDERGKIFDATKSFETATNVWAISESDGAETFYVKYGDLFAWICTILTVMIFGLTFLPKKLFLSEQN